ncbi:MAG: ATP-dependent DNA helicase [Clostridia bacterium]|nr:ATP-dependent DNA helicase [Clostridia bacterium]
MIYSENNASVLIDAKELCEIADKYGSLDTRHPFSKDLFSVRYSDDKVINKLYAGIEGYCSHDEELLVTYKLGDLYYTVSATADAVCKLKGQTRVDMVVTVNNYGFFAPPKTAWLSYLKCCALFVAKRDGLSQISLRLYIVLNDSEKDAVKHFDYFYGADELEKSFVKLLNKVNFRGVHSYEKARKAIPSAANALFPYDELREGQEMMIKETYSSIKQGHGLFLQAPTGTGKTVAALYPSVRALGNGLVDKIFYLTSKASTRREAFRGAAKLFEAGAMLRTIVIGAKEQVCMCPARMFNNNGTSHCNPDECSYAKDYYVKVEGAIRELLESGHGYTVRQISMVAKKYEVCPYELSLDLSELCDIIICDYNYVFDPSVYFRRYFSADAIKKNKYVFLVDEAHNLADRAREMYSSTLESKMFSKLNERFADDDKELKGIFLELLGVFYTHRAFCGDTFVVDKDGIERGYYVSNTLLSQFLSALESFKKKCEAFLKKNKDHLLFSELNAVLSETRKYLLVAEFFDNRFYNCIYAEGENTAVRIFCLDPSYILSKIQKRARSTIFFSATLTPLDYFKEILGGDKNSEHISLPSAFDPSNLCIAVAGYVSMRYSDRSDNVAKYVSIIAATVSRKAGNYIAYFPSYECMLKVYTAFKEKYRDVDTVIQSKNMTLEQKEKFLEFFKNDEGVLRIGFCVLGGSFSEGVDLPGARLIGTVIFGVGLPGLSSEKNIIRDYYDNRGESGYDYAYTFPGMNNVLQAAGRVIRTESDRGVVVLADDRYCEEKYSSLFPEHLSDIKKANSARELAEIIQNFWKNK